MSNIILFPQIPGHVYSQATPPHHAGNSLCVLEDIASPTFSAPVPALSLPFLLRYKHDLDPEGTPQFGLVAEQVEKVDPDLVARDDQGKPYTVRYEAVNAMLLNEFLKEHRIVQELRSTVAKQEAIIAKQQKGMEAVITRLDEQAAQITLAQYLRRKHDPDREQPPDQHLHCWYKWGDRGWGDRRDHR